MPYTHDLSDEALKRVWGEEQAYRVFLSHKAEVKKEASKLKQRLKLYGISSFVAHQDINPTRQWQNEIETALFSIDALLALMTDEFHQSDWTDQEVGIAFGREVPIIAVKLERLDPYGFIGKFQALTCTWDTATKKIVELLIRNEKMVDAFTRAVKNSDTYDGGNDLAELFPLIDTLSRRQISRLISAYRENGQVRGSYGFTGEKPSYYGKGLAFHLKRITGREYDLSDD